MTKNPKVKLGRSSYTSRNLEETIDATIAALTKLKPLVGPILARDLEGVTPDGYPSGGGEKRGTDVANPTERVALHLIEDLPRPDPVHEIVEAFASHIVEALNHARAAQGTPGRLRSLSESHRGRQSSVQDCVACDRTVAGTDKDRLRGGLCHGCNAAYTRDREAAEAKGDTPPDRALWAQRRPAAS